MKRAVPSWSLLAALAGAGCHADHITEPPQQQTAAAIFGGATAANLIECPNAIPTSTSALVTPLGGIVALGGTSISVPAGAVLVPTLIQVTTPASRFMEVDVSVPGVEHFVFELPVTVTIDYARCTRSDLNKTSLSAWYIDSETKALLEAMGGVDDKAARTVTFTTPHLSGYALAN